MYIFPDDIYALDGPGTYVVLLAIAGRHDKGWTGLELHLIIGKSVRVRQTYRQLLCELKTARLACT